MPHRPARPPLHDTAAWLLGRALTASDGTPAAELAAAAARLPCPVPEPLRTFYAAVGRTPALMQGFQRFAAPHEWECLGDKLLFLEENQGVCWWATDAQQKVWQTTDLNAPDWYAEPGDLETFLHAIAYYQMAQGGYPHCGLRAATGALATSHGLQGWLQSLPAQPDCTSTRWGNRRWCGTWARTLMAWWLWPNRGCFSACSTGCSSTRCANAGVLMTWGSASARGQNSREKGPYRASSIRKQLSNI